VTRVSRAHKVGLAALMSPCLLRRSGPVRSSLSRTSEELPHQPRTVRSRETRAGPPLRIRRRLSALQQRIVAVLRNDARGSRLHRCCPSLSLEPDLIDRRSPSCSCIRQSTVFGASPEPGTQAAHNQKKRRHAMICCEAQSSGRVSCANPKKKSLATPNCLQAASYGKDAVPQYRPD
jgi:hypothetical protein